MSLTARASAGWVGVVRWSRTTAPGFPPAERELSSTASTASTRPATGPRAGPGWGWRSWPRSPTPTAVVWPRGDSPRGGARIELELPRFASPPGAAPQPDATAGPGGCARVAPSGVRARPGHDDRLPVLQRSGLPGARSARALAGSPREPASACWRSSARWRCASCRTGAPPGAAGARRGPAAARPLRRATCARSWRSAPPAEARSTPTRSSVRVSCAAALHAAGAACAMVRALMAGEAPRRLLRRAPAGPSRRGAAGDGLLPVQQRRDRRAAGDRASSGRAGCSMLDWDVHHGNGTAEIFRRRADVLYASIHQSPFYPGTRPARRRRVRRGRGLHDQPARARPARARSCGCRCSRTSCCRWRSRSRPTSCSSLPASTPTPRTRWPAARCRPATFARDGAARARHGGRRGDPGGCVLEGGYNPPVLGDCVCAVLAALGGTEAGEGEARGSGAPTPTAARGRARARQVRRHWPL